MRCDIAVEAAGVTASINAEWELSREARGSRPSSWQTSANEIFDEPPSGVVLLAPYFRLAGKHVPALLLRLRLIVSMAYQAAAR